MSLNPRCYAVSQISHLVASITKKNYKDKCAEIAKVGGDGSTQGKAARYMDPLSPLMHVKLAKM